MTPNKETSLARAIIDEATRDPLGFLLGICQCLILLATLWGLLIVLFACAQPTVTP